MERVSIDVRVRQRELGKENTSRDQALSTQCLVLEMQRCGQRKIQVPGAKPGENGILKPTKKGFHEGGYKQHERIGDFDNKSFGGDLGQSSSWSRFQRKFQEQNEKH